MIFLKKFIEILNEPGTTANLYGHIHVDEVFAGVQQAKVFVFQGNTHDEGIEGSMSEEELPLSLPFKVCWFEGLDTTVASWSDEQGGIHVIEGVLIEETGPGKFNYALLLFTHHRGEKIRQVIALHDAVEGSKFLEGIRHIVKSGVSHLISKMKTEAVGFSKTGERVKLKTSKGKVIHKIRKIIHVMPKKARTANDSTGQEIDWSHRWLVMGHWRKLHRPGIGKDREGNYCVSGFTWINDYEKGPEHLPLISDKVRVIHKELDEKEKMDPKTED